MDSAQQTGIDSPPPSGSIGMAARSNSVTHDYRAVVNETRAKSDPPTAPAGTVQRNFRAVRAWAMLTEEAGLPLFGDLRRDDPALFSPLCVTFELPEGATDPNVIFLGAQLAALCKAESGAKADGGLAESALLRNLFARAAEAARLREPRDFELAWTNRSGREFVGRGFALPFSYTGDRVDCLLVTIAPPDQALETRNEEEMTLEENGVLLLDQELDPDTAPQLAMPPPVTPFILISLPASEEPLVQARPKATPLAVAAPPASLDNYSVSKDAGLIAALQSARELAIAAKDSEARSHGALYDAIGAAYDLAIAAAEAPHALAGMLEEAGIKIQPRSPLTGIVKLVFASDYDKTRLAEYSAALAHGRRRGLRSGELGRLLRGTEGGLKSIVNEERRLRQIDAGREGAVRSGPSKALSRRLRAIAAKPIRELSFSGEEFVLVLARRGDDGTPLIVGTISDDVPMLERAARRLLASQA